MLAIGALAWVLLIPAAFFVRQAPPAAASAGRPAGAPLGEAPLGVVDALRSPQYAVLAREYFGQRILGTILGAAAMVSSVGMALGQLGGGWIFDTFGQYTWRYVGSFALGLGAVGIALFFPALRRAAVPQAA